jgi:hypothetical protein
MTLQKQQPEPAIRTTILVIAALFLIPFIAASASAGAPPPDARVYNALPELAFYNGELNSTDPVISSLLAKDTPLQEITLSMKHSVDERFLVTDSRMSYTPPNFSMPFFPELSPYKGYQKLVFLKDDRQYIVEDWYFNDDNQFAIKKDELLRYLEDRGNASPVVLDFPDADGNSTVMWNITRYESPDTYGYFFVCRDIQYYPGTNWYIVYFGANGSSLPRDNDRALKLLMTSVRSPSADVRNLYVDPPEYRPYQPWTTSTTATPRSPESFLLIIPVGIIVLSVGLYWHFRRKREMK